MPKPTLTILPLQVPLCELFTNKAKHEEEAIRSRWLGSLLKRLSTDGYDVDTALEDADKRVINSLIKLFAVCNLLFAVYVYLMMTEILFCFF